MPGKPGLLLRQLKTPSVQSAYPSATSDQGVAASLSVLRNGRIVDGGGG
jgi:hypothetical protein